MQINVTRDKALTSDQHRKMKKGQIYISALSHSSRTTSPQLLSWVSFFCICLFFNHIKTRGLGG